MAAWILIVDSYEADADHIQRLLLKQGRSELVHRRATGREAWELLKETDQLPQLIMVDGRLPGMSALDFLKTVRSTERSSTVPVVFLSGDTREATIAEALKAGANSYLCKVFEYEQMRSDLQVTLSYWLDVHCSAIPDTPGVDSE